MNDMVEWLRAQLVEDERLARANLNHRTNAGLDPVPQWACMPDGEVRDTNGTLIVKATWDRPAAHIVRHDPARVLRAVAAERRLVDAHEPNADDGYCHSCLESESDLYGRSYEVSPCWHLRVLALPYSDRPGYRSEWAP